MRTTWLTTCIVLLAWCAAGARGADAPAADASKPPQLDAEKYPQDTPMKALGSLIKALEARDMAYWITHLLVPATNKRLMEKYGSLEKAVEANADPKRAARLTEQLALMKQMLAGPPPTEGEDNGVKWARFKVDQTVLQLEKQPDGRWCMNTRVKSVP